MLLKIGELGGATVLLKTKDRSIGIKVTRLNETRGILTVREVGGKRHFLMPFECSTKTDSLAQTTVNLPGGEKILLADKTEWSPKTDGYQFSVDGGLNDLLIDSSTIPPLSPEPSAQGLWSWLKGAANDIVAAVGAAATFASGGKGTFKTSGGGNFTVLGDIELINYNPGTNQFKTEPGLEEQPTIWY